MKIIKRILTGVLFAALFMFGFWFVTQTDFAFFKQKGFGPSLYRYFLALFFLGGFTSYE